MPNSVEGTGPWRIPAVFIALHNCVMLDYAEDVIALSHLLNIPCCTSAYSVPKLQISPMKHKNSCQQRHSLSIIHCSQVGKAYVSLQESLGCALVKGY